MNTNLYFAYGSNLNHEDMAVRCRGAEPVCPARLEGWRLTFRGVADIERAQDRHVAGALWRLNTTHLSHLDRYEGVPSHYRRRTVGVACETGPVEAITYVMCESDYLGMPSDWYLARIAAGYADWSLPLHELKRAVAETAGDLDARGLDTFVPDGPKRMRATNRRGSG